MKARLARTGAHAVLAVLDFFGLIPQRPIHTVCQDNEDGEGDDLMVVAKAVGVVPEPEVEEPNEALEHHLTACEAVELLAKDRRRVTALDWDDWERECADLGGEVR